MANCNAINEDEMIFEIKLESPEEMAAEEQLIELKDEIKEMIFEIKLESPEEMAAEEELIEEEQLIEIKEEIKEEFPEEEEFIDGSQSENEFVEDHWKELNDFVFDDCSESEHDGNVSDTLHDDAAKSNSENLNGKVQEQSKSSYNGQIQNSSSNNTKENTMSAHDASKSNNESLKINDLEKPTCSSINLIKNKCEKCGAQFLYKASLLKHVSLKCERMNGSYKFYKTCVEKRDDYYLCKMCTNSAKFLYLENIRQHIRLKHRSCRQDDKKYSKTKYTIKYLGPNYLQKTDSAALFSAINSSNMVGDHFICTVCPTVNPIKYKYKIALYEHMKNQHTIIMNCTECSNQYPDKFDLQQHAKQQHLVLLKFHDDPEVLKTAAAEVSKKQNSEKQLKCSKCKDSKEFVSKAMLKRHIRLEHLGIWYKCSKCNKTSRDKTYLRVHLRKTHNIQPNGFKPCFIETIQDGPVTPAHRHSAIRYGDKIEKIAEGNFICKLCTNSKRFPTKTVVAYHIKRDHYGRKYKCTECEMEWTHRSSLKSHLKRAHNIERRPWCNKDIECAKKQAGSNRPENAETEELVKS